MKLYATLVDAITDKPVGDKLYLEGFFECSASGSMVLDLNRGMRLTAPRGGSFRIEVYTIADDELIARFPVCALKKNDTYTVSGPGIITDA